MDVISVARECPTTAHWIFADSEPRIEVAEEEFKLPMILSKDKRPQSLTTNHGELCIPDPPDSVNHVCM